MHVCWCVPDLRKIPLKSPRASVGIASSAAVAHLGQDSQSATASCNLHAVATPQIPPMKMPNRLLTARKDVNVVQNEVPI